MTNDSLRPANSPPPPKTTRHRVSISAYVQLSFNDDIELAGSIGPAGFTAASSISMRRLNVVGAAGSDSANIRVTLRKLRPMPVDGEVIGQQLNGQITVDEAGLLFEGRAGREPLRYHLDPNGACSNRHHDLGLRVIYQSFYCDITGSVERGPDAVMVGLLLPVALRYRTSTYG